MWQGGPQALGTYRVPGVVQSFIQAILSNSSFYLWPYLRISSGAWHVVESQ